MSDMMNRETVLSVEDLTINFRTINGMVKAVRGISFENAKKYFHFAHK